MIEWMIYWGYKNSKFHTLKTRGAIMFKYLLQGLLVGLAYVAPIGTQNLYVINTAVQKSRGKTYQVALITIFFDISLAVSCFFGIGFLIDRFAMLKAGILIVGSLLVMYIGVSLIRSASEMSEDVHIDNSLTKVIGTCFAVTWLNPQALIDGSLLLGSSNAALPPAMSKYFIIGVCLASFIWFITVSSVILKFRNKINSNILKGINIVCGIILLYYGAKLGYTFIKLL
jgi:L-lysine exporter family protein LysE/ArgO